LHHKIARLNFSHLSKDELVKITGGQEKEEEERKKSHFPN